MVPACIPDWEIFYEAKRVKIFHSFPIQRVWYLSQIFTATYVHTLSRDESDHKKPGTHFTGTSEKVVITILLARICVTV